MAEKLFGWVIVALLFAALVYLYDTYPNQRAILIFGSMFSATLGGCAHCKKTS
jgi:hypothetical protein